MKQPLAVQVLKLNDSANEYEIFFIHIFILLNVHACILWSKYIKLVAQKIHTKELKNISLFECVCFFIVDR